MSLTKSDEKCQPSHPQRENFQPHRAILVAKKRALINKYYNSVSIKIQGSSVWDRQF